SRYRRRVTGAISLPFQTHPLDRMMTRSKSRRQEGATDGERGYDGNPAAAPTEARRDRAESVDQKDPHVYGAAELHNPVCFRDCRVDGYFSVFAAGAAEAGSGTPDAILRAIQRERQGGCRRGSRPVETADDSAASQAGPAP